MSVYRLFPPSLRLLLFLFVGVAWVGKSSSEKEIQRGDRLPDEWTMRRNDRATRGDSLVC